MQAKGFVRVARQLRIRNREHYWHEQELAAHIFQKPLLITPSVGQQLDALTVGQAGKPSAAGKGSK